MANYRKSFNFRNGVQVDNDNFVVTGSGLVGIGTSLPQNHILDVYGDTRISGLATVGSLSVSETVKVGSGITMDSTSGIISATAFYGDGSNLTDITIESASTAAYADSAGIATALENPRNFSVSGDVLSHTVSFNGTGDVGLGVTLSSDFSADTSGIITSTGGFYGNLTGIASTATELETSRNFSVSGDVATSAAVGFAGTDDVDLAVTLSSDFSADTSGIITSTGGFYGDLTGVASTATELETSRDFSVSGDVLSHTVSFNGTGDVGLGVTLSGTFSADTTGIITSTGGFYGNLTGIASTAKSLTQTAVVDINQMKVGISTVTESIGIGTNYLTGFIGIGATRIGGTDLCINRSNGGTPSADASVKLWSDLGASKVTIGTSESDIGHNAQIRYAYRGIDRSYSDEQSLDIINYGNGNINYYLQDGNLGLNTGGFHWHHQSSNLLSLTYEGNLGIGVTDPEHALHVSGISTFSDNVGIDGDLDISGDLSVNGNITFGSQSSLTVDIVGNVSGNITSADGNEDVVIIPANGLDAEEHALFRGRLVGGASTVSKLSITGVDQGNPILSVNVGGEERDPVSDEIVIEVNDSASSKFVVNETGQVGIGSTNPVESLDMAYAPRPLRFPNMTTEYRDNSLVDVEAGIATTPGSTIYNITVNKLQVWDGSTWRNCF